jgi:hypothetical protein
MSRLILPPPFDPYAYAEALKPPVPILFEPLHTRGVYVRTRSGDGVNGRICISRTLDEITVREAITHELGHHRTCTNVALRFGADESMALLGPSYWSPDHEERVTAYFECGDEMDVLTARTEEAKANKWAMDHLFSTEVLQAVVDWREEQGLGFGDGDDWEWLGSLLLVRGSTLRNWAQVREANGDVRGSNWHRPDA